MPRVDTGPSDSRASPGVTYERGPTLPSGTDAGRAAAGPAARQQQAEMDAERVEHERQIVQRQALLEAERARLMARERPDSLTRETDSS